MKNILFICNISLKNPIRGTPLRIYNFLNQIRKKNNLFICTKDINEDLNISFIPYPGYKGLKKIMYFINIIKQNKINLLLASTETGIKLPILLKFFSGVKIIIDLHGIYAEELYFKKSISKLNKILLIYYIKFYLSFYDLIFVISKKLKNYYKNINGNIEVIYGGVDLKKFKKITKSIDSDIFAIGYAGNCQEYQGFNYLLQVAKNIKKKKLFKFKLNLVLSGNRDKINQILKYYDLYNEAILHFNIKHEKVNNILSNSDILVIARPNIKMTEYAYPSKLPEYLATGIPTIITNVGPINELFINNDYCMVINHNNINQDLESAIIVLQKMSREERKIMGDKAIEFVSKNLTWDILGKKINKYLNELN